MVMAINWMPTTGLVSSWIQPGPAHNQGLQVTSSETENALLYLKCKNLHGFVIISGNVV